VIAIVIVASGFVVVIVFVAMIVFCGDTNVVAIVAGGFMVVFVFGKVSVFVLVIVPSVLWWCVL